MIPDVSGQPGQTPARAKGSSPGFGAADGPGDQRRRRDLRKMKVVSTGFLVVAAIVYLCMRYLEHLSLIHI